MSELYNEYLNAEISKKLLLCTMNPSKFRFIEYHEKRCDKILFKHATLTGHYMKELQ